MLKNLQEYINGGGEKVKLKDFDISRIEQGTTWVKIVALIRKNETSEIREYKDEVWWDCNEPYDDYPNDFMWSEGNYSCDCNRYLFFQRAKGENEDNDECGDDKYSVNLKNPKNGEIFYREYEEIKK